MYIKMFLTISKHKFTLSKVSRSTRNLALGTKKPFTLWVTPLSTILMYVPLAYESTLRAHCGPRIKALKSSKCTINVSQNFHLHTTSQAYNGTTSVSFLYWSHFSPIYKRKVCFTHASCFFIYFSLYNYHAAENSVINTFFNFIKEQCFNYLQ